MVSSFIMFAIVVILRVTAGTLESKFDWMSKAIPYLTGASIVMAVIFAIFVAIAIVKAVSKINFKNKKD